MAYENKDLKEALHQLAEDSSQQNVKAVLAALKNGRVLAPATWDKEPEQGKDGGLVFAPDTKISLMVAQNNTTQDMFFPMFTGTDEFEAYMQGKDRTNSRLLMLDLAQLASFLRMSQDDVRGILFNPGTDNLAVNSRPVIDAANEGKMMTNQLHKGDKVYVNEPEDADELIEALQKACKARPEVEALYLKERVYPTKRPSHWFLIVDSAVEEPSIFEAIGRSVRSKAKGKELEFLFGSSQLAQNIKQDSSPIYTKNQA